MIETYVCCSRCGKRVSNLVQSSIPEGLVIRAFVECPECVEKHFEPKPDESRLVEDCFMLLQTQNGGKVIVDATEALKLQDRKTAYLKDAECQQKVVEARRQERERIVKLVSGFMDFRDLSHCLTILDEEEEK